MLGMRCINPGLHPASPWVQDRVYPIWEAATRDTLQQLGEFRWVRVKDPDTTRILLLTRCPNGTYRETAGRAPGVRFVMTLHGDDDAPARP